VNRAAEGGARDPAQQQAVREANQAFQEAGVPQRQGQAGQNVQNNTLGEASGQQGQAAQDLQNLAEALRQAANANDPKALQRQLAAAMQNLRRMMSEHQRQMDQTRANPNAQQRAEIARNQRELQ